MKRYKADLFCHIVAFTELTVEADTPEQARDIMLADAKKLHTYDWDLQEIEDDSIQLNANSNLPDEIEEGKPDQTDTHDPNYKPTGRWFTE